MHFENQSAEVFSDEFYLTQSHDPDEELSVFIHKLNSRDGERWACRFPARYDFVRNLNVPEFDLQKCQDLSLFVNSFQGPLVSLAMASELPSSPASAFGHILLVFHTDKKPSFDSDTIHFAAQPEGQRDFLTYSLDGVMGNFQAYYFRDPLFKKIYEYGVQEQRHVFYFTLQLEADERDRLLLHLYELRNIQFKYYFFRKNCAYHLESLIRIATRSRPQRSHIYTLPMDVVRRYQRRFINTEVSEPSIQRIQRSYRLLNEDEKEDFFLIESQGLDAVPRPQSDLLRQTIYLHNQYQFRHKNQISPFYQKFSNLRFNDVPVGSAEVAHPLDKPKASRFGLSQQLINETGRKTGFELRPVVIDRYDLQENALSQSEQAILEIKAFHQNQSLEAEDLRLIHYRVMNEVEGLENSVSWLLDSGINRYNLENRNQFENQAGLGQTYKWAHRLLVSPILGLGFLTDSRRTSTYGLGDVLISSYLQKNLKLNLSVQYKNYFPSVYWKNEIAFSGQTGDFLLKVAFEKNSLQDWLTSMGVYYYF